jgi:glutamate-1-semialdehyde 2,1-aminomutase
MDMTNRLATLRERAARTLPAGVSRGFNWLPDIGPLYFASAHGPYLRDVDGNEYIDYVVGWGSLLLGHDPPAMRLALRGRLDDGGFLHQYETEAHLELAELVCECVPCADRVRFTGSGLEATLFAIRLARAYTGRQRIIKFEGHFHGLHDHTAFATCSTPLGAARPDGSIEPVAASAGLPDSFADLVMVVPYNDIDALVNVINEHPGEIAAIIMEPIALNMGCIGPAPGYLEGVRSISREAGIVLIFDEVLTGFRVALGGAQEFCGVVPDLACFSKAFGCGMPIAALAGRADLMDLLGPPGPVPMSGTHSARLLSVVGTLASMRELMAPGFYDRLQALNDRLVLGLRDVLSDASIPAVVDGWGGRVTAYVGLTQRPRSLRDVAAAWDGEFHAALFRTLVLRERIYGFLPLGNAPDPLTLSAAHSEQDIDQTLERFASALRATRYREPRSKRGPGTSAKGSHSRSTA